MIDTEKALIQRTLDGDLEAFGDLVERHRDVVFRVAARVVVPDDADDVSQDTLLRNDGAEAHAEPVDHFPQ